MLTLGQDPASAASLIVHTHADADGEELGCCEWDGGANEVTRAGGRGMARGCVPSCATHKGTAGCSQALWATLSPGELHSGLHLAGLDGDSALKQDGDLSVFTSGWPGSG